MRPSQEMAGCAWTQVVVILSHLVLSHLHSRDEKCMHTLTHTQMHRHLAHRLEQLLAVTKHHVCILRKTLAFRIQLASEYTQMVFMF